MAAHEPGVGEKGAVVKGEIEAAEAATFLRHLHWRQPGQDHGEDEQIADGAADGHIAEIEPQQQRPELRAGGDAQAGDDARLGVVAGALPLVGQRRHRRRAR